MCNEKILSEVFQFQGHVFVDDYQFVFFFDHKLIHLVSCRVIIGYFYCFYSIKLEQTVQKFVADDYDFRPPFTWTKDLLFLPFISFYLTQKPLSQTLKGENAGYLTAGLHPSPTGKPYGLPCSHEDSAFGWSNRPYPRAALSLNYVLK